MLKQVFGVEIIQDGNLDVQRGLKSTTDEKFWRYKRFLSHFKIYSIDNGILKIKIMTILIFITYEEVKYMKTITWKE